MTDSDTMHWGELQGVPIEFPMVVAEMLQATLTFTVPLEAARALLVDVPFEVVEVAPGSAMFMLALVDYRQNPWGDYNEVNMGLLAHPADRPEHVGAYVYRMPVDQEFTRLAGNEVLGLPKTVEQLSFSYPDGDVLVELSMGGQPTLRVRLPRVQTDDPPTSTETVTFSMLDGRPTELPLTIDLGSGVVDPAAVQIELGDSEVADELRSLGLPCAPDMALWGEGLSGTFLAPRPL